MSDWIVHGTAPWDAPPLTEHQLAKCLARTGRVLFVEPVITPLTPFRYGVGPGTAGNVRRIVRRGIRRAGQIDVVTPVALPPASHSRARRASGPWLRAQIRSAARQSGLRAPIALAGRWMLDLAGAAGERGLVYLVKDWIEAGPDLIGRDSHVLARERDEMCAAADLVCAISPGLQDALGENGIAAALLPHGFDEDMASRFVAPSPPSALDRLPRPLLGFTGRIDGRLDYESLARLADAYPAGTVLLVGPISPRLSRADLELLHSHSNIVVHGSVAREELPALLQALDCCLLPYRRSEWIRRAAPLKLWDYLYAGPPIVGAGCDILADLDGDLLTFVEDAVDWPKAVVRALEDGRGDMAARRRLALSNTWRRRAEQLSALATAAVAPVSNAA